MFFHKPYSGWMPLAEEDDVIEKVKSIFRKDLDSFNDSNNFSLWKKHLWAAAADAYLKKKCVREPSPRGIYEWENGEFHEKPKGFLDRRVDEKRHHPFSSATSKCRCVFFFFHKIAPFFFVKEKKIAKKGDGAAVLTESIERQINSRERFLKRKWARKKILFEEGGYKREPKSRLPCSAGGEWKRKKTFQWATVAWRLLLG